MKKKVTLFVLLTIVFLIAYYLHSAISFDNKIDLDIGINPDSNGYVVTEINQIRSTQLHKILPSNYHEYSINVLIKNESESQIEKMAFKRNYKNHYVSGSSIESNLSTKDIHITIFINKENLVEDKSTLNKATLYEINRLLIISIINAFLELDINNTDTPSEKHRFSSTYGHQIFQDLISREEILIQ